MARGTIFFLFILSLIAVFLLGINLGKRLPSELPTPIPAPDISTTPSIPPTSIPKLPLNKSTQSGSVTNVSEGLSTFTNRACGFSFSYPGSYLQEKTVNEQSIIITDPDDPTSIIATTCAQNIPRPPIAAENIEAITLDGQSAMLYHDQDPEGNPRDEIIVTHPANNLEIIIAGYGNTFQEVVSSFKFID